jgi:hypothetical protein
VAEAGDRTDIVYDDLATQDVLLIGPRLYAPHIGNDARLRLWHMR